MTRKTKKELELEILRKVFPRSKYRKYTPREQPDFIIHSRSDFGVEVVEYYPDETIARLHNQPNYAGLVTDKTYIHKDDVDKLKVVNMEYQDRKTGKWKKINVPGVMQENMTVTDRLALLVKCIDGKSSSLKSYNNQLETIDLIVQDSRNTLLDGTSNNFVLETLNNFRMINRFKNSGFRHIYVILPPSKGVPQHIVQIK